MKRILATLTLATALTGVAAPAMAATTDPLSAEVKLSRSFSSVEGDGRSFYSITSDGTCNSLAGCDNVMVLPWRYTTE